MASIKTYGPQHPLTLLGTGWQVMLPGNIVCLWAWLYIGLMEGGADGKGGERIKQCGITEIYCVHGKGSVRHGTLAVGRSQGWVSGGLCLRCTTLLSSSPRKTAPRTYQDSHFCSGFICKLQVPTSMSEYNLKWQVAPRKEAPTPKKVLLFLSMLWASELSYLFHPWKSQTKVKTMACL